MPGRRKDLRPKAGTDAPSCDKYNPTKDYIYPNKRSFSVSKQRRDGEVELYKMTPGVGSYHPDNAKLIVKPKSATFK